MNEFAAMPNKKKEAGAGKRGKVYKGQLISWPTSALARQRQGQTAMFVPPQW